MSKASRQISITLPSKKMMPFYVYLALIIAFSLFCYNFFLDMGVTASHSSDFLDCILRGDGLSFYDYAYQKAELGEYFGNGAMIDGAIYSPVTYLLIGIIMLPVYIPSKIMNAPVDAFVYAEYLRLIMLGISIGVCHKVSSIHFKYSGKNTQYLKVFFLSSPMIVVSVLACNQFDIIAVLIGLFAFAYYLEDDLKKSTLLIAISTCLKPFLMIFYIPLLLYKEKNILRLSLHLISSVAPMAIISLLCRVIFPGYQQTQVLMNSFYNYGDYVFNNALIGEASAFVIAYCIVCSVAYLIKPEKSKAYRCSVLLGLSAYMSFFLFAHFHLQWGVYLLPWVILAIFSTGNIESSLIMDIGFEAFFAMYLCHRSSMRIMIGNSIMAANISPLAESANWDFYSNHFESTVPFSFMAGFGAAFLVACIWDYFKGGSNSDNNKVKTWLAFVRSSVSLIYLIPPVLCYFGIL